jgi:hypothetical protein
MYRCMYVHTCRHTSVHAYINRLQKDAGTVINNIHTYIPHTHTTCTHMHIHIYTNSMCKIPVKVSPAVCKHTHTHTHVCSHTYIHIPKHTQKGPKSPTKAAPSATNKKGAQQQAPDDQPALGGKSWREQSEAMEESDKSAEDSENKKPQDDQGLRQRGNRKDKEQETKA